MPLLTIELTKEGDQYHAELHAASEINGVADQRITAPGAVGIEALHGCLTGLEALAKGNTQRGEIARRFI